MSNKIINFPLNNNDQIPFIDICNGMTMDEKFIRSGIWKAYLANGGSENELGEYCTEGLEEGMKKAFVKRLGEDLFQQYVLKSKK